MFGVDSQVWLWSGVPSKMGFLPWSMCNRSSSRMYTEGQRGKEGWQGVGSPFLQDCPAQRREVILLQAALCIFMQKVSAVSASVVPKQPGATSQLLTPLPGCGWGHLPQQQLLVTCGGPEYTRPAPAPADHRDLISAPPHPHVGPLAAGCPPFVHGHVCLTFYLPGPRF